MSVNIQRNGTLFPIAGSGGNPEDIEELRAQIAQMKTKIAEMETALEGKAGIDDKNVFTQEQHVEYDVSPTIESSNCQLVVSTRTGDDSTRSGITFINHLRNSANLLLDGNKLKAQFDSGLQLYNVLDSRDMHIQTFYINQGRNEVEMYSGIFLLGIYQDAAWSQDYLGVVFKHITDYAQNSKVYPIYSSSNYYDISINSDLLVINSTSIASSNCVLIKILN